MALDWSRYPNFSETEFACKCGCGRADMDSGFMDRLQALREACGFPFPISSGFRCPAHNAALHGGPAHELGRAADVAVFGEQAHAIAALSGVHGFTGLGVQQKGSNRFIHLDDLRTNETRAPRPWIWSY